MRLAIWFAIAISAVAASRSSAADLSSELASARALWSQHGSDHYRFTISDGCFCLHPAYVGPLRITVVDGKAKRAVYVGERWRGYHNGRTVTLDTALRTTVPELFDRIAELLGRLPHENFRLQFDPWDGHPIHFTYDDPRYEDEQTQIVVEDFAHLGR